MTRQSPNVSIIIPTLNSARTLEECLQAIANQSFPRAQTELIIADAGSTDDTLTIANRFGVDRIVDNPLKTGEAGKSAGIKVATGEIIALVDSDNIIDDPNWIEKMIEPFDDPDILGSEPLEFTWRKGDPALTRYFAMLGMNDPLCLFLGNYDRLSLITGKWTGLKVAQKDEPNYIKLSLDEAIPTIGANGFVFRRELLKHVTWEPYFFDIDIVAEAVAAGKRHFAKVKCGIVHLYCSKLSDFMQKQDRRVADFLYFSKEGGRSYPWHRQSRSGIALFCISTITILPLLIHIIRGARRRPDRAWLYHIIVCWTTLWIYGVAIAKKALGFQSNIKSRDNWQPS